MRSEVPCAATGRSVLPRYLRVSTRFVLATICAVAFAFTFAVLVIALFGQKVGNGCDFIIYWATGQQLAHHSNPYDQVALAQMEQSTGLQLKTAYYMRNPPWTLPLVLPFGHIGLRSGVMIWSLLVFFALAISVYLLWKICGRPRSRRYLIGCTFAPALLCLIYRQTSLFVLLGFVLFLYLHRSRPFFAGMSLWLCLLKPHLFLPFGVVFLAWVVVTRNYRVVAGALTALGASVGITFIVDPLAWAQYSHMLHTSGIEMDFNPCLSFLLCRSITPHRTWIQYIPTALSCAWALGYFWTRRDRWDWMKHGSLLMLVGVLTAPYCWIYDQVLAIPGLMRVASNIASRDLVLLLAALSALVEASLIGGIWVHSALLRWNYWTAPAWLAWYLIASASESRNLRARGPGVSESLRNKEQVAEILKAG